MLIRALSRANDLSRLLIFLVLEHFLPKRENLWCFCTWNNDLPHTIDNPRGVFEAVKADASIAKIVLLKPCHAGKTPSSEGNRVTFVQVESLKGAYLLARSRVVFLGYSLTGLCSYGRHLTRRHAIIQLWHGIPLKRIGKLFPGESFWDAETPKYSATVCSATRDQGFMSAAFAPTPNVWLTGLPRNDLILKPENQLPADYRAQLDELRQRIGGRKFILYAPTWRDDNSGIYPFSDTQLATLKSFLTAHHAVIGVRAHSNRRPGPGAGHEELGESLFFVNDIPDANLILRLTDVLITDYSSIYIDFLVTGRPILNFTYDLDSYVKERGFLYELAQAMPDAPFLSFEDLLTRLDAALDGERTNDAQYSKSLSLFHGHAGSPSVAVATLVKNLTAPVASPVHPLSASHRSGVHDV